MMAAEDPPRDRLTYRGKPVEGVLDNYPHECFGVWGFGPANDYCTDVKLPILDKCPALDEGAAYRVIPYSCKEQTRKDIAEYVRNIIYLPVRHIYIQLGSEDNYDDFNHLALATLRRNDFGFGCMCPRGLLWCVSFYR